MKTLITILPLTLATPALAHHDGPLVGHTTPLALGLGLALIAVAALAAFRTAKAQPARAD